MKNLLNRLCNIDFNNIDKCLECYTMATYMLIEKHNQLFKMYLTLKKKLDLRGSELFGNLKNDIVSKNMTITEMKLWIEKDRDMIELKYKMEYLKLEISTVEKHIENIKSARWDCKTLIEYQKLKSGLL